MKNQFHPKYQRKYFWSSALKFFVAFWGLPGSFLGFQQPSLFMILLTKSPGSPKSFQEAPRKLQKFQGRNPEIFSLVSWMKLIFHKDILKLTYLQYNCNYKPSLSGFKISTSALNHYFNGQCMCNEHITIEFSYNTSTCQVPNCEPAKQNKYACICTREGN